MQARYGQRAVTATPASLMMDSHTQRAGAFCNAAQQVSYHLMYNDNAWVCIALAYCNIARQGVPLYDNMKLVR